MYEGQEEAIKEKSVESVIVRTRTFVTRNRWTRTLIIRKLVRIPIRILTFNLYWPLWGYVHFVVFSLRGGSYHTSYHPRWKYTHSPT